VTWKLPPGGRLEVDTLALPAGDFVLSAGTFYGFDSVPVVEVRTPGGSLIESDSTDGLLTFNHSGGAVRVSAENASPSLPLYLELELHGVEGVPDLSGGLVLLDAVMNPVALSTVVLDEGVSYDILVTPDIGDASVELFDPMTGESVVTESELGAISGFLSGTSGAYVLVVRTAAFQSEFTLEIIESSMESSFLRGDSNTDGGFDIADAIFTLAALFTPGSPGPLCTDSGDANDDGAYDIGDAIFSLGALFSSGPTPPEPGAESCGIDPTDDFLGCASFPPCP